MSSAALLAPPHCSLYRSPLPLPRGCPPPRPLQVDVVLKAIPKKKAKKEENLWTEMQVLHVLNPSSFQHRVSHFSPIISPLARLLPFRMIRAHVRVIVCGIMCFFSRFQSRPSPILSLLSAESSLSASASLALLTARCCHRASERLVIFQPLINRLPSHLGD